MDNEPGKRDTPDAEYLRRSREGDDVAFAALYERHAQAGLRYAHQVAGPDHADDLVSEAFARIWSLLRRGQGPTTTFRAYLGAVIRSVYVDQVRKDSRHMWVEDLSDFAHLLMSDDLMEERFQHATIGKAFRELPERWRTALWFSHVEGMSNQEIADLLGINRHAVSQLNFRAREALRVNYLAAHANAAETARCKDVLRLTPSYVRGSLSATRTADVEAHVAGCQACATALAEMTQVNQNLSALLTPLAVGGAAFAALHAHPSATVPVPVAGAGTLTKAGLAIAGAAALAALGFAVLHLNGPDDVTPRPAASPPTSGPVTAPTSGSTLPTPRATTSASGSATPSDSATATSALPSPSVVPPLTPPPPSTPPAEPSASAPPQNPSDVPAVLDIGLGPTEQYAVGADRPDAVHLAFATHDLVPGVELVVTTDRAVDGFSMHTGGRYGTWRCDASPTSGRRTAVTCLLQTEVDSLAPLAFDLNAPSATTVTARVRLPSSRDPRPSDNSSTVVVSAAPY